MTWFGWLMLAWMALGTLAYAATIAEDTTPPAGPAAVAVVNGLMIVGLLIVGTGKL